MAVHVDSYSASGGSVLVAMANNQSQLVRNRGLIAVRGCLLVTGNGNHVYERVSPLESHGSCAVWKGKAYMYKEREREREKWLTQG